MRSLIFIFILFNTVTVYAQITPNPRVQRKSVNDVYVNKIEITEDYTILSLQYISKTADENLREYLQANPRIKDQLSRMSPMMRGMMLNQLLGSGTQNTISIQPSSYLISKDGKKFKFIKATNIPVAPDRKTTRPGEKYFFKAYFEKLDQGITQIDFIENEQEQQDGFVFWNMYGVDVNNPASNEPILTDDLEATEILIKGKIYDAISNQTIAAYIKCQLLTSGEILDEMNTSKAGAYAFELPQAESYLFEIKAKGYEDLSEEIDLTIFKGKSELDRSIFLYPKKAEEVKEENILEEPEIVISKDSVLSKIDTTGVQVDESNTITLKDLYFAKGKSKIMRDSYDELDRLVIFLNNNPELKIRIDGHTDNQGDSQKNKVLSLNRAKNVRDYVINKGISAERISFKGWGDTKPVASNSSEQERQKNRRVEVIILK